MAIQPVMSLFSSERETGIVMFSGEGICEGRNLTNEEYASFLQIVIDRLGIPYVRETKVGGCDRRGVRLILQNRC